MEIHKKYLLTEKDEVYVLHIIRKLIKSMMPLGLDNANIDVWCDMCSCLDERSVAFKIDESCPFCNGE